MNQKILPAASTMKDFEKFLQSGFKTGVILETHLGQIKHITQMAKMADKQLFFHVDLINGLKNDEYGTQYLCQEFKPFGVISTKSAVIQEAKKHQAIAVQRIFMIDSHALERSYKMVKKSQPDYIEVLPGALPNMIKEVAGEIQLPIFAGGLIRTVEEAKEALEAGAVSITSSKRELWQYFAGE
ncbi:MULTISPECIES: glycerol-3-phosphate responsive antiterminator [Bacillaceae]|uniref:glycerol-3-phosphate responsive antiterminator n=1 Tax=Bacillaceae TaxID=186817 RepID=UPI00080AFD0E|nr:MULTISPECIES: glycerol-3-phosphate responsive antiterminator [Bacillaceae]OCA90256.1 glycerol-3-phosphate responsive antiterminator GlpP [Bacillus sp. FJAT-27986]